MSGYGPAAQNVIASLANHSTLLMKLQILSLAKNYDVMDESQQVLCRISLDAGQNMTGEALKALVGKWAARTMNYTYSVHDASGNVAMQIRKGSGAWKMQFDVVDAQAPITYGSIRMKRGLLGGMKAEWVTPGGQVLMQTKGNIVRRKYVIQGPEGREIGKVRHKILAIRDVWQLELDPGANHLYSAIFATILDFEKKM
jgi:uncharacterized protein YxjI